MESCWETLRNSLSPVPEGHAVLGLSGGADSVALLYLLLPLQESGRLRLEAVHVNHGLRGEESDRDEAFAAEICHEAGIPFHSFRVDLGGSWDENSAREKRYACYRSCLQSVGAAQLILAHHQEDQAETFLMRLLRGAGPEGLGCMRPVEQREGYTIYRPMLGISGKTLRETLKSRGIPWREDSSNAEDRYFRNRIRHLVLPQLESLAPGAVRRIARAAELIAMDHDALTGQEKDILHAVSGPGWIQTETLGTFPEALRCSLLRRWWRENVPEMEEHELDYRQTNALTQLCAASQGAVCNLPGGWRAERGRRHLHLIPPEREPVPPVPWHTGTVDFGGISLQEGSPAGSPGDGVFSQEVPPGYPEGCVIRTRRPGDRIRPFGMEGSKSLQDYLTDRKIDRPWRERIPLLCRNSEVLLVAGVGAGAVPFWRKEEDHIRLTWKGEMPWAEKEEKA